ncbi:MAG: DNA methyltransferase, partial [Kiritimatiellae bacterium]|nr:DNA methyltransferase [Kiritimatiellia bacterium]
ALTGWEPPKEKPKQMILMPELEKERDAANRVKQGKKIIVVLGNPPYNGFAGVSPEEENDLVKPYKEGLVSKWGIKKFNLDDLYVRFFRLAEKRIAEHSGMGVVSFISNHSWVSEPSFVVMRRHLLDSFDRFWIENMHGNRKISEYAPDGRTSETVFAIPGFSVGIQQGVAISLWVKHAKRKSEPLVRFRNDIDAAKATERRAQLTASLSAKKFDAQYETAAPAVENRWSFRPSEVTTDFLGWPKVTDLCEESPSNGLMEKRGGALIDNDRDALSERMRVYYDKETSWEGLKASGHPLTNDAARYNAQLARRKVLEAEEFDCEKLRPYALRPFDNRWCYYSTTRPLWNEPRPTLWAQCWAGNRFLMTRPAGVAQPEGVPFFFTNCIGDNDSLRGHAYCFPLRLKTDHKKTVARMAEDSGRVVQHEQNVLFDDDTASANLSPVARAYLHSLGLPNPDEDTETAEVIWMHALAIGYAPAYLTENADGIRQDWPRIPLPSTKKALLKSAALGRQVAALLDTETPVVGVTAGSIREDLKGVAVFTRTDGKKVNPDAGDLDLTAGWGHAGKGGVTMPGRGKIEAYGNVLDIYLNGLTCWRNVPAPVWEYTIGGYQVIKKWLSYREKPLLGRGLTVAEVRYVTETARRIAALISMQPQLDENCRAVAASCVPALI